MCYDISFTIDMPVLRDYFPDMIEDDQIQINLDASEHILGPGLHGEHAILFRNKDDKMIHLRLNSWGVIPFWVNDTDKLKKFAPGRNKWLNIRAEKILEDKNSYWYKIRNRRCLIPVTGIFEHREVKGQKKKIPYLVWPCNQQPFFLPGLYSVAEVADTDTGLITTHKTFGLITRAANSLMRQIHNSGENKWRMPLFLPLEQSQQWLNDELSVEEYQELLNYEMPSDELAYRSVYTIRGTKPRPDRLGKTALFEWNEPALGTADPD